MDYLQDPTPEQECADACKDPAIIKAFMNHLPDPDKLSWGVPEEHTRRQLEILGEAFTLLEDYQAYQAGYAQTIAGMLGHRVLYNLTDIDSCATMCMSIAREAESAAASFQRLINEYRAIARKEN